MKSIYLFIITSTLLIAACTPQEPSTPTLAPSDTPITIQVTPVPPSATPSPRPIPSETPVPTPTVPVTLYNRYVGKDVTRQTELIKTPLGNLITVQNAEGYARSSIAIFLNGKQVNGEDIRGDPVMLAQLVRLYNDAFKAQHVSETVLSAYRSYENQVYLKQQNSEDNDSAVAPAGRSEHQLGTAVDLAWGPERLNFYVMDAYPPARAFYNWLKENAQRYGFIFSYPYKSTPDQSKTNLLEPYITEYKAEPWHLRYVGPELAQKIYATRDEQGRNYLDPLSSLIPQKFLIP
jgi:D-alanyl-D-alanine carboxypeptidase